MDLEAWSSDTGFLSLGGFLRQTRAASNLSEPLEPLRASASERPGPAHPGDQRAAAALRGVCPGPKGPKPPENL